jgi:hypothetical protein
MMVLLFPNVRFAPRTPTPPGQYFSSLEDDHNNISQRLFVSQLTIKENTHKNL